MAEPRVPMLLVVPAAILGIVAVSDQGPAAACAEGSVAVQQALGDKAAYPDLQRACALGDGWGCYREYVDRWDGNVDAWFYMLTGMCEKGTAVACMNLSVEYGRGDKGRKDEAGGAVQEERVQARAGPVRGAEAATLTSGSVTRLGRRRLALIEVAGGEAAHRRLLCR